MTDVRRFFRRPLSSDLSPDHHFRDFNAPPSTRLLVVCPRGWVEPLRWGLPTGESDIINARVETYLEKPTFAAMEKCLVLVSGFYEFSSAKVPFAFRAETPVICLAGLRSKSNLIVMTRPAFPETKSIHERFPMVFLTETEASRWLDTKANLDIWRFQLQLDTQLPPGLKFWQVANKVKNPTYKDPDCIHRVKTETDNRKMDEFVRVRPSLRRSSESKGGTSGTSKPPSTPSKGSDEEGRPREVQLTAPYSDVGRLSNGQDPPKPEEWEGDGEEDFHFLDEAGEELRPAPQSLADVQREEGRLGRAEFLMLVSDYFSGRIEALRQKPN